MAKKSKEYEERRELLEFKNSCEKEKHKMKMVELEFLRESNKLFHERELERGRIKWAEIRKTQERKALLYSYKD